MFAVQPTSRMRCAGDRRQLTPARGKLSRDARLHQLRRHAHAFARPADTPLERVRHAELAADLRDRLDVSCTASTTSGRRIRSRRDEASKLRDHLVGQPSLKYSARRRLQSSRTAARRASPARRRATLRPAHKPIAAPGKRLDISRRLASSPSAARICLMQKLRPCSKSTKVSRFHTASGVPRGNQAARVERQIQPVLWPARGQAPGAA